MSSQFRSRNNRNRYSRGSSPQFNSQSSSSGRRSNSSHAVSSNSQKSQLAKAEDEYKPPFNLFSDWKAEEFYKLKIPHPHLADEKETVQFPVLEQSNATLSDRALFYKQVLDIQDQVAFDGNK